MNKTNNIENFFNGLSEDEKLILNDLNGPSWSPEKKIKKTISEFSKKNEDLADSTNLDLNSIKKPLKTQSVQ